MTTAEKNQLAALLIRYALHEVRPDYELATHDKDFETAQKLVKLEGAIDEVLESLGNK